MKLTFHPAGILETKYSRALGVTYDNVSRKRHPAKQSGKKKSPPLPWCAKVKPRLVPAPRNLAWKEQHGLRRGLRDGILSEKGADIRRGGGGSEGICRRIGRLVGSEGGCPP